MATVPAPAASWIVQYLRTTGTGRVSDWTERGLTTGSGLNSLIGECIEFHVGEAKRPKYSFSNHVLPSLCTVRQLRAIWNAVERYTSVRKPATHAKKAVWVEQVRRVFFTDYQCTVPNTEIITQLTTGSGGVNAPPLTFKKVNAAPRQHATQPHGGAQHAAAAQMAPANAGATVAAAVAATQPRQATYSRGPQTLARRPQTNVAAARSGPQSLARARPQQSNATTVSSQRSQPNATAAQRPNPAALAAAAAAQRQAQNFAFQQAAAAAFAPYGSIAWMPPPSFQVPPHAAAVAQMPPRPAPVATTAASSSDERAKKKVKQEPGVAVSTVQDQYAEDDSYWDTRARTNLENEMVLQLRQMGFTDMREILTGIRHVVNAPADIPSQVESVMMWIVAQREEAEEARKIDAARARSESLRAEQAQLRKQAAHERLWGSTMNDWLTSSDLFKGSIVLKETRHFFETTIFDNRDFKEKLIRFLELEKKARKWYGTSVPYCFLCSLCERWKELSTDELAKSIEQEATSLEKAMYSLAEQEGGVPKIFREAKSNAEKNGRPTSPLNEKSSADDDDDDDDIIVVKEVSAAEADARMNTVSSNGKKCEVIDLL